MQAKDNTKGGFPPQSQAEQPGKEYLMHPKPESIRGSYKGSDKLLDKVALITGGDSGIGRSIAIHFAREGADIAIVYKQEEQKDATDTKQMVEAEGRKCLLLSGDIRNPDFCKSLVGEIIKNYKKINILVNNAAEHYPQEELQDISDDQLESTFQTNVYSFFRITKEALNHMQKGDCIINTTSVTAYRGSWHLIDYASTKGAVVAFTRSLSANLAEKGIRVNGVAPGPVWTPLIPASMDEEKVAKFGTDVPMGRAGQPSEIGPAFVFLACEDASYITGQIIHPNGGEIINS